MTDDVQDFKAALSRYLTGVTVVTTVDETGRRWGFTATSFSSVSLRPPQILVCIARSAQCYEAFQDSPEFAVNVVNRGQERVAERFAQRGGDKFTSLPFGTGSHGLPVLYRALAVFECSTRDRHPAGDHTILVGEVFRAEVGEGAPTLYYNREFHPALLPDT